MYEVTVMTHFAAAHQLRNFGGKCEQLHGHNWKVEVTLKGEGLNDEGLLIDFQELRAITNGILEKLDHSFLNELPAFKDQNPSSENIAAYIFKELRTRLNDKHIDVAKVTAWESDSASASYMG
ncbi:MAG: 6-carboxytetrahydropterin synthase QueD [Deltaproteobacteria bacterium]|nr:6-carboxytetrahydropterin synthase QueD [Deltaproteobacteria bacterium]MBW2076339.1 6-carboxytetrahydropterin synthase QueD [Deltaproteobacteria bacterium]RLB30344.1 MAG: 6-carboxytetrahydropterin synthase QueD [Deltaproteobacteria bacterium]